MYDFQMWWNDLKADFILNFVEKDRWMFITSGLKNTLLITFFSLILGVVLGVVVAIVRSSYDKTQAEMRNGFKKFIMGFLNAICKI